MHDKILRNCGYQTRYSWKKNPLYSVIVCSSSVFVFNFISHTERLNVSGRSHVNSSCDQFVLPIIFCPGVLCMLQMIYFLMVLSFIKVILLKYFFLRMKSNICSIRISFIINSLAFNKFRKVLFSISVAISLNNLSNQYYNFSLYRM